jgi:hypothetical protein
LRTLHLFVLLPTEALCACRAGSISRQAHDQGTSPSAPETRAPVGHLVASYAGWLFNDPVPAPQLRFTPDCATQDGELEPVPVDRECELLIIDTWQVQQSTAGFCEHGDETSGTVIKTS